MTKKLPMSPDVSYMLGVYNCNSSNSSVGVSTTSNELVERFVQIAVFNLGIKPDYIDISKDDRYIEATINNSKLKKLFDNALEKRDRTFKYKNEYSASYFAGIFDCRGAIDNKGIFLSHIGAYDAVLLERIGFHTRTSSGKTYIKNDKEFIAFIAPFSIKAQTFHQARSR